MMNATEVKMNEQAKNMMRKCFLQTAVNLELQLAEAMGHKNASFVGNIEDGYLLVGGRTDGPFPKYVRDPAATFKLMCEYNCVPDRSSLRIPYNEGWAYVPGTKARVDLAAYESLEQAYAVVIAMAVIEKISQ
jgi:hypothetical protein